MDVLYSYALSTVKLCRPAWRNRTYQSWSTYLLLLFMLWMEVHYLQLLFWRRLCSYHRWELRSGTQKLHLRKSGKSSVVESNSQWAKRGPFQPPTFRHKEKETKQRVSRQDEWTWVCCKHRISCLGDCSLQKLDSENTYLFIYLLHFPAKAQGSL